MDKALQRKLALYQKANRIQQNTPAVMKAVEQLQTAGFRFIREKGFFSDYSFYLIDLYLPKPYKLCIEIDGSSHSGREWYDQKRDKYLTEVRGFTVLRLSNEQVLDPEFDIVSLIRSTRM